LQFNQTEISSIEKICSDVYSDFGNLNNGGCGVFARAMNELFKTNTFLYVFDSESLEQDPPTHVYLKLKPGKYLDVIGFSTKRDAYNNYGWSSSIFTGNEDLLNSYYDELGEGLFVTDYKDSYSTIKNFIFAKYFQLKFVNLEIRNKEYNLEK
jgi:hypothetical protein